MESESGTKSEWILYEQVVYKAQAVSVAEAQPQPVTRRATCDGEYLLRVAAYTYIYIYIYIPLCAFSHGVEAHGGGGGSGGHFGLLPGPRPYGSSLAPRGFRRGDQSATRPPPSDSVGFQDSFGSSWWWPHYHPGWWWPHYHPGVVVGSLGASLSDPRYHF